MKVSIDEGAFIPVKAHAEDGGFDLKSPIDTFVPANGSSVVDTGVHMAIKRGYAGLLVSKSGLNTLKGITSTGLIDSGYLLILGLSHGTPFLCLCIQTICR